MADGYKTADKAYEKLSEQFTELNKEYNRALHADKMTDDLELRFMKAERELHEAYRVRQAAKIEENA